MIGICARRTWASLGLSLAVSLLGSTIVSAAPQAIKPAEEAAIRLVVAHLTSGPGALWDATSRTSPLRVLGRDEGTKEIELRVGPAAGSEWELVATGKGGSDSSASFQVTFASGADDTVSFTMVMENGVWKIAGVRSMSDPVTPVAAAPAPVADAAEARTRPAPILLMILAAATLLFAIATLALRNRSQLLANAMAGTSVVTLLAFGALFYLRHESADERPVVTASVIAPSPNVSRTALVSLRRRLAAGEPLDSGATRGLDETSTIRAALWDAQLHLQRNDIAGAKGILAKSPRMKDTPLAQVVEGRIAFLQHREVDAAIAYERAIELSSEHDHLLYEAASVLLTLGFDERAKGQFHRLAELGSREPSVYYSLAVLEAIKGSEDAAEQYLLAAYKMRPELRSSLVRVGVLYGIYSRPGVRQQFAMHQSDEPLVRPANLSERPLAIPPGASARCLGDHLEVDLLGSTLHVPSGAVLAPQGTPVLDAGAWDREEASGAMTSARALARVAAQPSTYAQPALSRRIEEAAFALASHNRWKEVADLTTAIDPSFDLVPADLLLLKAQAQTRTGQPGSAQTLLRDLAARPALLQRLNARQLVDAGEILASLEAYDLAIRMMDRASQKQEGPNVDDRIRQLTMNQRLATFRTHTTPHFTIRYSEETGTAGAENIARIAEAELQRLQAWVPAAKFRPVVINVLSWETFRNVYTGSNHVAGFYNGQITIPFAGVGVFPPEIVAILSHELAHAMIAQATNDMAPRWFQEGLAQRVESVAFQSNPFNMYDPERLPAFALLDDFVSYSPDPALIAQGYLVTHAVIRYVESRWGPAGVARLLASFASGATTEEAIEHLSGGSLAAFDKAFVAWGTSSRQVFENTNLVSYEEQKLDIRISPRAASPP